MKRFLCVIICVLIAAPVGVFAAEDEISVIVSGEKVSFDVMPEIIGGRTFVPVRAIFEAMGADVEWNADLMKVTGEKLGRTVELTVGRKEAFYGSRAVNMDAEPIIKDGRTLVPVRYVAEGLGYKAEWNGSNKTVTITHDENSISYCDAEKLIPDFGAMYNLEGVKTEDGVYIYDLKDIAERDPKALCVKDYMDILYDIGCAYFKDEVIAEDGAEGTLYMFVKDKMLIAIGVIYVEGEPGLFITGIEED